jgi:predicted dehydrogenase
MGQHHARVLSQHPAAELVAIVDTREATAHKIAAGLHVKALASYQDLFGHVQAVSIATPTSTHFEVAGEFIKRGVHVLVEKPITATVQEASELIALAREKKVVLQVGHIERFNAAIRRFREIALSPVFIEAHRLGPYDPRVRDIGVVMDLMIHDLDIILNLVQSPVISVEAVGCPILSERIDIANARLHFENGCIANLTASRLSPKQMRKIRIFQGGPERAYVSIDYDKPSMETYRVIEDKRAKPGQPPYKIQRRNERLKKEDKLQAEIGHFLDCVARGVEPQVNGQHAQDALQLAVEIDSLIRKDYDGRAANLRDSG